MNLVKEKLKYIRDYIRLGHKLSLEKKAVLKGYKKNPDIEILLLCHALEKGMGVNNVKHGYGIEKANRLLKILEVKKDVNYALNEALSVLQRYIEFQEEQKVDVTSIKDKYNLLVKNRTYEAVAAGYGMFDKEYFMQGKDIDFKKFIDSRHSLRNLTFEPIEREIFEQAIEMAAKAPSACNRQPYKVYYSTNMDKNKQLAKLVPGNKSFENDIPYYCVVTSDRSMFSIGEIYQWFVNGGIFVAFLTLALHSLGIGSCIFQYPVLYESKDKVNALIGCSKNEEIIAIIGYGYYPESAKCICATRKPIEELVEEF